MNSSLILYTNVLLFWQYSGQISVQNAENSWDNFYMENFSDTNRLKIPCRQWLWRYKGFSRGINKKKPAFIMEQQNVTFNIFLFPLSHNLPLWPPTYRMTSPTIWQCPRLSHPYSRYHNNIKIKTFRQRILSNVSSLSAKELPACITIALCKLSPRPKHVLLDGVKLWKQLPTIHRTLVRS